MNRFLEELIEPELQVMSVFIIQGNTLFRSGKEAGL